MFSNYMTGLEMNEYGMSNLEINKNTNLKLYEAVRTGSSASQTVPFPSTTCNEKDWVEHSKH